MNALEQKKYLESIIENQLSPLIDHDYVYWDLPYHINIGDTLIWQGTLDFLKKKSLKMLDFGNSTTADLKKLHKDTIILLHGGGNFGDIYSSSQNFRKLVVDKYPNNKIIILPQTIFFENKNTQDKDLKFFSKHQNLFLCVRDHASYNLATQYLDKDKVLLLPDMAFCINNERLNKGKPTGKKLLMSRIDIEAVKLDNTYVSLVDEQSDWPTFEKAPKSSLYLNFLIAIKRKISKSSFEQKSILDKHIDSFANQYLRKQLISIGINFINHYDYIYTTRLHGCILSLLLDKEIILLDNSYGKNKAFHDAWLKDSDNIKVESC